MALVCFFFLKLYCQKNPKNKRAAKQFFFFFFRTYQAFLHLQDKLVKNINDTASETSFCKWSLHMEAIPVYRQGLDEGSEFALRTQKLYQLPHMRFCVNLGEGL